MPTTTGSSYPNFILNISAVSVDHFGTMAYMSGLDQIVFLWCQHDTNAYCGIMFFDHPTQTILGSDTFTYGTTNDYSDWN